MFDIDKELNEIRNINVVPSAKLIARTKEEILHQENELEIIRKRKRKRITRITIFSTFPVAVAAMLIMFVNMAMSKPVAYYSLDINPNINMVVDKDGIVTKVIYEESDIFDDIKKDDIVGNEIELAISKAIIVAQDEGYIKEDENVLIGCFGEDKYNNISKNLITSYLENTLDNNINLMSIHGSMDDWNNAKKNKVSAGLYALNNLSVNIFLDNKVSLDELILMLEKNENKKASLFLLENAEPIVYKAPQMIYTIEDDYISLVWEYIDYKNNNYDGEITYQLISSEQESNLLSERNIIDEYTFSSWAKQPIDYILSKDEVNRNKHYGIIAIYDDGTYVMNENIVFIP